MEAIMEQFKLFQDLLKLESPWSVINVEIDNDSNRLDLELGIQSVSKRNLFGKKQRNESCSACNKILPDLEDIRWKSFRHINFGSMRTYLHLPDMSEYAEDDTLCDCWPSIIQEGTRYSKDVIRLVTDVSRYVDSHVKLAEALEISLSDVNVILSANTTSISPPQHDNAASQSSDTGNVTSPVPKLAARNVVTSEVPPVNSPAWQRLMDGVIEIETDAVALKMLLERIRQTIAKNPAPSYRTAATKMLHQYFLKNKDKHADELAVINAGLPAQVNDIGSGIGSSKSSHLKAVVPPVNSPAWQRLMDGVIEIETDAVALKMLLERIRQTIAKNPAPSYRTAATKMLHQYFLKNKDKHADELAVINTGLPAKVNDIGSGIGSSKSSHLKVGVPPENSPAWQRLMDGVIEIETDAVALKMLLERIRQTIAKNPAPSYRTAATKMLYQYFLKNEDKHSSELQTINAGLTESDLKASVTAINADVQQGLSSASGVPPVNSPAWQSLMDGAIEIETDAVALKMLLERIRQTIAKNPAPSYRAAATKMLHQYFVKNEDKHVVELSVLNSADNSRMITSTLVSDNNININISSTKEPFLNQTRSANSILNNVPEESHPVWKRLILGQLDIKTDEVSLQMIVERVRLTYQRKPSEAIQSSAIKILRTYFLKYQNRHQAEINQLLAA
jgi:hypothetical protein